MFSLTGIRARRDGMIPEASDVERLIEVQGRPIHSYRDFAADIVCAA